ncbi:hypothetical protein SAMN05444157_1382 [Frankineae bacterium MT45]|nr:hypothetical protein SAMN05444157_1382 [Frankineae bacterium MT45]
MTADWARQPNGPQATSQQPGRHTVVNAGRLWAGGVATGVVAALFAVAGIVVVRGVFDIPVLAPKGSGVWGSANTVTYAFGAFAFSLVACGFLHLLLVATPSPYVFFGWIMALCTVIGTLAPFGNGASLSAKVATAVINLIIGIAIWSLLTSTAHRSVRRVIVA